MFSYRPNQGTYARGTAFWALAGFAWMAGRRSYFWFQRFNWANDRLLQENVPVLGFPLTWAVIIGFAIFFLCMWGVWKLINHPKIGDLLIDTELEMKKVTWPSFPESRRAAFIVIICVLIMVGFIFVADAALNWMLFGHVYGVTAHGG